LESDSTSAIIVWVVSLLFFTGVSSVQSAFLLLGERGGLPWPEGEVPTRPIRRLIHRYVRVAFLFSGLKFASVLALGLSLAAWALSGNGASAIFLAFLAVGMMALIAVAQGVATAVGRRYHTRVLWAAAPIVVGMYWISNPLLRLAERLNVYVQRRRNGSASHPTEQPSEQEDADLHPHVEEEVREAAPHERRMIEAILGLEDVSAGEIMVPRVDILAVDVSAPMIEVVNLMAAGGHSRIVVYKDTVDNVVGIAHARDLVQSLASSGTPQALNDIIRPPLFVPDSMPLGQLLRDFQERHASIAVVVDEYGGTEGLVTVEDLLEEIVGEIEDEFALKEPPIVRVNDQEAIVDGRATLDEVNEVFHTSLAGDGFNTVGGLLSTHLGKIPIVGDSMSLGGLSMHVLSTTGRRVRKVKVTLDATNG